MEDRQIIELLFSRAEIAIDALAKKFGKRLYSLTMNILHSGRDAEECVNDTYLILWNKIPPERPDPLSAYTYRIGRNTALKKLRANTAQARNSAYDLSLDELAECIPDDSLWDVLDARELGRSIDHFLSKQSLENRSIFIKRYWYGDSVKHIAKDTGIREGTISVRLNRMRAALKDYLCKEGYFL
jgi:RNA polymerase sigma-70 factor (ECF subfamily)